MAQFMDFRAGEIPSMANALSALEKGDIAGLGFWGGPAAQGLYDQYKNRQNQDAMSQRKEQYAFDIAKMNSGTNFDTGLMSLMGLLSGQPIEWAKLGNARDIAQMKNQWDLMEMLQKGMNQKEVAQISAGGHERAAQTQADARIQAAREAAMRPPNIGNAPESFLLPKIAEIQKQAVSATGNRMPEDEAVMLAQREWNQKMTGIKMDTKRQIQQQVPSTPTPAMPQKTSNASPDISLSIPQMMGLASPEDFLPTGSAASVQMVPGSFVPDTKRSSSNVFTGLRGIGDYTITPEDRRAAAEYYSGPDTPQGSARFGGNYRDSGVTQALKQAFPGISPMYQNREIQEEIASGYRPSPEALAKNPSLYGMLDQRRGGAFPMLPPDREMDMRSPNGPALTEIRRKQTTASEPVQPSIWDQATKNSMYGGPTDSNSWVGQSPHSVRMELLRALAQRVSPYMPNWNTSGMYDIPGMTGI